MAVAFYIATYSLIWEAIRKKTFKDVFNLLISSGCGFEVMKSKDHLFAGLSIATLRRYIIRLNLMQHNCGGSRNPLIND
jgi:hypothetical protein